jgi:hypothetical protein
MNIRTRNLVGCLLLAGRLGCAGTAPTAQEANSTTQSPTQVTVQIDVLPPSPVASMSMPCPVTLANGSTPPGEKPSISDHGNGALWTGLWPGGTVRAKPNYCRWSAKMGLV